MRGCFGIRRGVAGAAMLAVLPMLAWSAAPASAHMARHRLLDTPGVAVEFGYSDGSIMPYAEIKVFAPGLAGMPQQIGRTDARGRFAFVPHRDGTWLLAARDDDGHTHDATVEVTGSMAPVNDGWRRGALFASVFANLALLAVLFDRYRKTPAGGSGMSRLARFRRAPGRGPQDRAE